MLLVDDDPNVVTIVSGLLSDHGFGPVYHAWNGESAIHRAHCHRPRFIVMERVVSDPVAARIVSFLRRERPDLAVIVFSGRADKPQWADALVLKPETSRLIETLVVLRRNSPQ